MFGASLLTVLAVSWVAVTAGFVALMIWKYFAGFK